MTAPTVTLEVEFTFVIERPGICPRFGVWWPEAEVELPIRAEVTELGDRNDEAPCVIWSDLAAMQDLIATHEITPNELEGIEEAAVSHFDEALAAGKLGVASANIRHMSPRELLDAVKALGAA